ncbi:hypothetical protein V5799_029003 [Amblyomma americanum]|uniref:Uncharacterized protein n=1 Tax=Amblyomma americanum TaxID=6943 RepID=A0AAQ4ESN0_AMBAM
MTNGKRPSPRNRTHSIFGSFTHCCTELFSGTTGCAKVRVTLRVFLYFFFWRHKHPTCSQLRHMLSLCLDAFWLWFS